jgi:hypothetical protein
MVIRAVAPDNKRKRKAPKIFRPTSSGVDEGIIRRFIDQQDLIVNYIGAFEDLDLGKIIISSPVSSLITYSLMDSFRIIITHERRHVLQAIEVAEMDEFPTARNMV